LSTFVPIVDGAEGEIQFSLFDRPCEVTLHFLNRTPPTTTGQLGLLAVTLGSWFSSEVLNHLSSDLLLRQVQTFDASVSGSTRITDVTFSGTGGIGLPSYPASVAAVVSFIHAFGGSVRSNRNYIPGIPGGVISGNNLSLSFRNAMIEAYQDLIDIADGINWRWVCVKRFEEGAPLSEAVVQRVDHVRFNQNSTGQRRQRLHNTF